MNEKKIECPACHACGTHSLAPMADVSADPQIKKRLLDGSFFEWTCPACSRRFFVDEVFLCCNPDGGYCVYLVPGYQDSTLPVPTVYKSRCKGTLRVTPSYTEFAEKLRILDAKLDDRIIEAMKTVYATICQQTGQDTVYNMIFEEIRPDGRLGFAVLRKDDDTTVDILAEAYEHAQADFDKLLPKGDETAFLKVDQEWLAVSLQEEPC